MQNTNVNCNSRSSFLEFDECDETNHPIIVISWGPESIWQFITVHALGFAILILCLPVV